MEERTDADVGVDGREEAGADAVLVILLIRDVQARARVAELLREPKVDDVHEEWRVFLFVFWVGDHEVRGLDVAVYKVARVHVLYARELYVKMMPVSYSF